MDKFCERYRDRIRIIFVSVDSTEDEYAASAQHRASSFSYLEYNDGSSATNDRSDLSLSPPAEPFLLASEVDLEEDLHLTDPEGALYLRPFSRVYLAEHFKVFGVPQLVVYHVDSAKILTRHARLSLLKTGPQAEETLGKWERGESTDFGILGGSHPSFYKD